MIQTDVAQRPSGGRIRPTRPAPHFFALTAVMLLLLVIAGFYPYYLRGEGLAGRKISPQLATLVFVHGGAMTAWLLLFLVQTLLVSARKLRMHMRLGWSSLLVALVASTSGFMLAVQSVRPVPDISFWGMTYRQFLLVMLTEVALFTLFVIAGVLARKRPKVHRAMMLLASLSMLAAATVRMPALARVFGDGGWVGIFGPIFALGALLVVVRSVLVGAVDRWLVAGYVLLVAVYMAACAFAVSEPWNVWARALVSV